MSKDILSDLSGLNMSDKAFFEKSQQKSTREGVFLSLAFKLLDYLQLN